MYVGVFIHSCTCIKTKIAADKAIYCSLCLTQGVFERANLAADLNSIQTDSLTRNKPKL